MFCTERSIQIIINLLCIFFVTKFLLQSRKGRTQEGRPDSDKVFKAIVKESATNFAMENIQQALKHMVSDGKLMNREKFR